MTTATLINGFVIGWSVAWPPGPINAEILRRTLLPRSEGGGFWNAWQLGLGACTGDFLWAVAVMTGAGALLNTPRIRLVLGVISFVLLVLLAAMFARNAWRSIHESGFPKWNLRELPRHRGLVAPATLRRDVTRPALP